MTLTILMSFSVLALVVTARPILPNDAPQPEPPTPAIHDVVQAIFQSRTQTSPDYLSSTEEHDIHLKLTSPEEQHAVLSSLDEIDAVKTIVSIGLDGVLSEDEKKLYNIISTSTSGGLDDLDGGERIPEEFSLLFKPDTEDSVDEPEATNVASSEVNTDFFTSPPLIVLGLSCIAAFLTMGCIAVAIYTTRVIRKRVLGSSMAWELLPRLERHEPLEHRSSNDTQRPTSGGNCNGSSTEKRSLREPVPDRPEPVVEVINEKVDLIVFDTEVSEDEVYDEKDEKFHDAEFFDVEERPLSALDIHSDLLPQIIINEEYPDPDLLPLPQFSTPFSTPPPSPPRTPLLLPTQMRETSTTSISSPLSKPAWSLRAADAPALGLASASVSRSSTPRPTLHRPLVRSATPSFENLNYSIPGALYPDPPLASEPEMREVELPGRGRAYRAPVPELDIAFAMQLRPGLGLGSDPAWLVRFLMAMFGWMTVLIGGGNAGTRRAVRAIA